MLKKTYNIARARQCQERRRRIRAAARPDRLRLLRTFGDDIRALAPMLSRAANIERDDIASALEVSTTYGMVLGAWLTLDPTNAEWPARDKLFVVRRDDLINACAALSALGFFPPEAVPEFVEMVDTEGRRAVIPGIESPGAPVPEIPDLVWQSAVESARNKKRWREAFSENTNSPWLESGWSEAPETWRTCVILDVCDPITDECRKLTMRTGDKPAGLVALVKAPRDEASAVVDDWWSSGWDALLFNRSDVLQVYELMTTVRLDKPLALVLATGNSMAKMPQISRTIIRRRESGLLGEMSDDQFNAIMGESLKT